MRFLGIGDSCDLLALYRGLLADGHDVKVAIKDPLCHGTGAGMIQRIEDWRRELDWIRQGGRDGIILFESIGAGPGADQDALRAQGFNVIGGSAYGDRLENDRAYAQSVLAGLGLPICRIEEFDEGARALEFLDAHPGRYVLKFNGQGASRSNYVGRFDDGRDVRAVLAAKLASLDKGEASFVLMEHVKGVEMGVGAYFNGSDFLRPACLDWEHKRFFAGDLGELTGEMGTVATYDRTHGFFDRTLARMGPLLRQNGYCGYINLNTIVNDDGIWPLEFTCRFGYPGFAILDPLQTSGWASIFRAMIRRDTLEMKTRSGFAVGVVVTTPPFPYNLKRLHDEIIGLPVLFDGDLSAADEAHLHFGEIGFANDQLVTTGAYGWTMVVTGEGPSIATAKTAAYDLVSRVYVPDMRYRLDIGDRLIAGGFREVERLGLLDPV